MTPRKLILYMTPDERTPYSEWVRSLRDVAGALRVRTRMKRVAQGHLGDHKSVGGGVHELRFDFGPGYRVYFGMMGDAVVILLCGGDKGSQGKDVARAKEYWADWNRRRSGR